MELFIFTLLLNALISLAAGLALPSFGRGEVHAERLPPSRTSFEADKVPFLQAVRSEQYSSAAGTITPAKVCASSGKA